MTGADPAADDGPQRMRFGPLNVCFDTRVLRPRPWTLAQSRWGAELLAGRPEGAVLELCSGVGHIGLTLGLQEDRDLVLVDVDEIACAFARTNAAAAGHGHRVDVRLGRMGEVLAPDERFELILADPPYLPSSETGTFPGDPLRAIDGGQDGLGLARECVEVAASHLTPGGEAVLQLRDPTQADQIGQHVLDHPNMGLEVREVRVLAQGTLARIGVADPTKARP